jgi:beta-1,4-mannooligosaccharide/beta-1,4-mannosyl-N-acetylglucosamine phosphorylase
MSSRIINGDVIKNLPWEERPQGNSDILWRSEKNPIITRDLIPCSNSIFNSAVVPFGEGYAGVFRVDDKSRHLRLHSGKSKDAVNWNINHEPIQFICEDEEIGKFEYGYDPRVCKIEDKYYVTWCNYYHGPTIGVAFTYDFETFCQIENAYLPFNRNGVLFPRKINGKYAMLSRPSDNGHTPFGDIFYSESPDMIHWGCHRHVMSPTGFWQSKKIGAGPVPIETSEGWLLIYHGVMDTCNGFNYSMGAALLELEKPWKVKYRTSPYILSPQKLYECVGDTPNVVFPCAALADAGTGRLAVYYGGADTVTCMAFGYVDELIDFIKANSL